jgi:late competence protein required for DNA uptake (superfamily II DNA/RNA helicase)
LDTEFMRVELIDDPAAIAEHWVKARRGGGRMICRRCGDAEPSIAAILVVPAGGDTRWALCRHCLLEMP